MASKHFHLIVGTVEYQETKHNKATRSTKVNCLYEKDSDSLMSAKDLSNILTQLQLHFHRKYSERNPNPPHAIADVIIENIVKLGEGTSEDFLQNAPKVSDE